MSYKAGITGVDHNRNYPQEYFDTEKNIWVNIWQKYRNNSNAYEPSSEFYSGPYPGSEPEVQAIMKYILTYDFRSYISFHSRGNIIYWNKYFAPEHYNKRTKALAEIVRAVNGYKPAEIDNGKGSGYISDFTSRKRVRNH